MVVQVAKQGGEKWKSLDEEVSLLSSFEFHHCCGLNSSFCSLTVQEKKVYLDKAAELKAEYNKSLESSNDADEEVCCFIY